MRHMKGLIAVEWKDRVTLAWKGNFSSTTATPHDAPAAREIVVAVPVPAHACDSGGQRDRGGGAGGTGLLFLHARRRDRGSGAVCRNVRGPPRPWPQLH